MMRSPASSKRALILPVRLRRVASGLMIERVRSTAMVGSCEKKLDLRPALYPWLGGQGNHQASAPGMRRSPLAERFGP